MRKSVLDCVMSLARRDPRVVFIGSDLGAGVLADMKAAYPDRFFMEGVSEAHVIGMAAGLALEGFIPYVNTIATFISRRAYEQVALDLCLHRVRVRLIASGGGSVYAPLGPTHMAIEDFATMRALPNMTIVAPSDANEMKRFMERTLDWPDPIYIRLAKGSDPVLTLPDELFTIGKAISIRSGHDIAFISTGIMTYRCVRAAEALALRGISAAVLHMPTIKPLDVAAVAAIADRYAAIVTVEEHLRIGGLGSVILETLNDLGRTTSVLRLGFEDAFIHSYGTQNEVLSANGLDEPSIIEAVLRRLDAIAATSLT